MIHVTLVDPTRGVAARGDTPAAAERTLPLTIRYPTVPITFCETRPLAEEWTYRFLGAALAHAHAEAGA